MTMKTKKIVYMLLLSLMLLSSVIVFANAAVAGTIRLVDANDGDSDLYVEVGVEPSGWPLFDVEIEITNVTSIIGAAVSITYNSSLFDLDSIANITAGTTCFLQVLEA
jgi:hypothetical protein